MRRILDVFATYCDCYLEYWDNFLTIEFFCDYYDLDIDEMRSLQESKTSMPDDMPMSALDYYHNRRTNNWKIKK